MKIAKNLTYYKGLFFELFACLILLIKGYKILKRDYKARNTSQIDVLALKNNKIRVIEVKYRKKSIDCICAISHSQEQRIKKSAINISKKYNKQVVIDGMFFSLDFPYLLHKRNIF